MKVKVGGPPIQQTVRFVVERSSEGGSLLRDTRGRALDAVDGRVIEAQFSVGSRVLLVLSDDVPFEERFVFLLLDDALRALDSLEFGGVYVPGVFRLLGTTDLPSVLFTLDGEHRYELLIQDPPRRSLRPTLTGVRRPGGPFRPHHLLLRPA